MDERNTLQSLRTTRVLPVDLNAILAKSERLVSEMARDLGDMDTSETFKKMSEEREAALQALFWDERLSKWRDVLIDDGQDGNCKSGESGGSRGEYKGDGGRRSLGFARGDDEDYASDWVPLWCLDGGSGNDHTDDTLERRRRAVRSLEASKINQPGGMASSSVNTGEQWDWPNVWPPSQYFLAEGCWKVGDEESKRLGDSIRDRYLAGAERAWGVWNALPEKFDCTVSGGAGSGGEYACVIGFGWSVGLAISWLHDQF
jgi:alpha,alpha-trehalase